MGENNKEFTNDNIMKVLLKMTPENKGALLAFEFEAISCIANDAEYAQKAIENCDKYIDAWKK